MHRHFKLAPRKVELSTGIEIIVFAWGYTNHWFTVQANSSNGSIKVYDSLSASWPPAKSNEIRGEAGRTLPMFVALAGAILKWPVIHWVVEFEDSLQQNDSSSCGPITVENCLRLLDRGIPRVGNMVPHEVQ